MGKLGNIGCLGGFWASAWSPRMNRMANGGIVCFDCGHRLESRLWVLRKRAPFYNGVDRQFFAENSGFLERDEGRKCLYRKG